MLVSVLYFFGGVYIFPIEKLEDFFRSAPRWTTLEAAAQRSHEQQMAALNAAKRVLSDARPGETGDESSIVSFRHWNEGDLD